MTAPERIWATIDAPQNDDGDTTFLGTCWMDGDGRSLEYVRADLYATLAAEKERLESERDERVKLSNQWMNCAAYYRQELTAAEARIRELKALVRALVQAAADCNPAQGDDIRRDPAVLEARALLARTGGEHDRS